MLVPNNNRKPKHDRLEDAKKEFLSAKESYDKACAKFAKSFANHSKLHEEEKGTIESLDENINELFKVHREAQSFCEDSDENCTMNYCDENGCQRRTRCLVEPSSPKGYFHVPTMPGYLVNEDLNVVYLNGEKVLTCGPHDFLPAKETVNKPPIPEPGKPTGVADSPSPEGMHKCKYCDVMVEGDDEECYKAPRNLEKDQGEKINKKIVIESILRCLKGDDVISEYKDVKTTFKEHVDARILNMSDITALHDAANIKLTNIIQKQQEERRAKGFNSDGEEDDAYHLVKAAESLKKVGITLSIKVEKP